MLLKLGTQFSGKTLTSMYKALDLISRSAKENSNSPGVVIHAFNTITVQGQLMVYKSLGQPKL